MQKKELRERTQSLDLLKRRYFALFDCAPIGFFILDSDRRITEANKAGAELLEADVHRLIGAPFMQFIDSSHEDGFKTLIERISANNEPEMSEVALRTANGGEVPAQLSGTAYFENEHTGPYYQIAATDVTQFMEREHKLEGKTKVLTKNAERLESLVEERTHELKGAQRFADIGERTASIGHDLRNPLQALRYSIDLHNALISRIPAEQLETPYWQKENDLIGHIARQVEYMDNIVTSLYEYMQAFEPKRTPISVQELVTATFDLIPVPPSVQLHTDVPAEACACVDPALMQRALSNIITNSLEAMPRGGQLTIAARETHDSLSLRVTDTGVGIPGAVKDDLFSPLVSSKTNGSGLGLAITKRIIEAHGGMVSASNNEDIGSTLTITLPNVHECVATEA
jgi:PAS domain S-box-containing protein